jgi:hypothetical protein
MIKILCTLYKPSCLSLWIYSDSWDVLCVCVCVCVEGFEVEYCGYTVFPGP